MPCIISGNTNGAAHDRQKWIGYDPGRHGTRSIAAKIIVSRLLAEVSRLSPFPALEPDAAFRVLFGRAA